MTTFALDERTIMVLSRLRQAFGVKTNAAAIRKALALADIAVQHAGPDNTVTFAPSADGRVPAVKVSLSG